MPDQMLAELASRAGDAAHAPPFDELARRGRRLRRNRAVGAGVAVAALLTVTMFGVQGLYDDQSAPIPPTRPTAPQLPSPQLTDHNTTPLEDLTAQQIVYDDTAKFFDAVAVPSGGPEAMASLWSVCRKATCVKALALTTDAFSTAAYVNLSAYDSPEIADIGRGSVLVADRGLQGPTIVVSLDGSTERLRSSTAPGPLLEGEALLDGVKWAPFRKSIFKTLSPVAINSLRATSHPISTPEAGAFVQLTQSGPTVLSGSSYSSDTAGLSAVWSDDGGETWRKHELEQDAGRVGVVDVPGGAPDTMALGLVFHDVPATDFRRSRDGGATWETIALPREQASLDLVEGVLSSNGSLLLHLWATNNPNSGLYASEGEDWSSLTQVDAPFAPADGEGGASFRISSSAPFTVDGTPAIYGYNNSRAWASTDDGATWSEIPTR